MKNEISVKTDNLQHKRVRSFFTKEKLKWFVTGLRILTIVLYLVLNIALVYDIFSMIEYPAITDKYVARGVIFLSCFTFIIPCILIGILFIKKENIILKILKGVIQVGLLVVSPYIYAICGLFLIMSIPSHTTNPANYEKRDTGIDEVLDKQEFSMLPHILPDNIVDVKYLYDYQVIFDDDYLTLEISWTYNDESDYENAKAKMQSFTPVNNQVMDDGFQMLYAIGTSSDDVQRFCFGYDDETKRVTYKIYYEWVS